MQRVKLFLGITIICLICGIGQSQWLETTILLPDTSYPLALCYNSVNNKVYSANVKYGSHNVAIIDGATNSIIDTVTVGNGWTLFWNSTNNKVYCASGCYNGSVAIMDGTTNSVITWIPIGGDPNAFVFNSTNNKVYCANPIGITIIDGFTNSIITTLPVGDAWALAWNSFNNKVYCAKIGSDTVIIIDGITNSVITTVTLGSSPSAFVYNPTNNKVYCANNANVTIIDGATNQVITMIPVQDGPHTFAYNPQQNRVYVANEASSSISVIRDVTGIEDRQTLNASSFAPEIFPNPAKSFLAIRLPQSANRPTLKIFDMSGEMIKEIKILRFAQNDGGDEVRISLKGINPGIYFLRLGKETKKFLIVK